MQRTSASILLGWLPPWSVMYTDSARLDATSLTETGRSGGVERRRRRTGTRENAQEDATHRVHLPSVALAVARFILIFVSTVPEATELDQRGDPGSPPRSPSRSNQSNRFRGGVLQEGSCLAA